MVWSFAVSGCSAATQAAEGIDLENTVESKELAESDENLIHCIYASASTFEFTPQELEALLSVARRNNKALNITGMLLYERGSFFQVLEGPSNAVETLYTKIGADKRHAKVVKLIVAPIKTRNFSRWSMGHALAPARELAKIDGLNDFFQAGKSFTELDDGRVKKLLKAFKEGQWRSTIVGPA